MRRAIAGALLLNALAGCGEDGATTAEPSDEASATPETVTVEVLMYDEPPLEVLYNGDGGKCTSNFLGLSGSNPSVTLYDADGSIVGTQELADEGGGFDRASGCQWALSFDDIEPSDFYEATLTTEQYEYTSDPAPAGESLQLVL